MEYLIGAIVAIFALFLMRRFLIFKQVGISTPIIYRQSHIHQLIYPFLPDNKDIVLKGPPTQSTKHYDSISITVAYAEGKAYWIRDNTLFVADMVDGHVDEETKRQVDTMSMSRVELNKMAYIVEQLTGDDNDSRDSGK
jgi:hypothetical protein